MLNILNWISFRNYLNAGKDLLKSTERKRERERVRSKLNETFITKEGKEI